MVCVSMKRPLSRTASDGIKYIRISGPAIFMRFCISQHTRERETNRQDTCRVQLFPNTNIIVLLGCGGWRKKRTFLLSVDFSTFLRFIQYPSNTPSFMFLKWTGKTEAFPRLLRKSSIHCAFFRCFSKSWQQCEGFIILYIHRVSLWCQFLPELGFTELGLRKQWRPSIVCTFKGLLSSGTSNVYLQICKWCRLSNIPYLIELLFSANT